MKTITVLAHIIMIAMVPLDFVRSVKYVRAQALRIYCQVQYI